MFLCDEINTDKRRFGNQLHEEIGGNGVSSVCGTRSLVDPRMIDELCISLPVMNILFVIDFTIFFRTGGAHECMSQENEEGRVCSCTRMYIISLYI